MKSIRIRIKNGLLTLLVLAVLMLRNTAAFADDPASPTPAPTSDSISAPTPPTQPTAPTEPTAPTPPTSPSLTTSTDATSQPIPSPTADAPTTTLPNDPLTSGNGASSSSTTQASSTAQNATTQQNNGQSTTGVTQTSTTGNNSSSGNVGNSAITTSGAHVAGTVLNGINTNLGNVSVSQFTVAGDQNGDIVLDPSATTANCILNCGNGTNITTTNNGTSASATTGVSQSTQNSSTQQNTAGVGNTLVLSANSGNNTTNLNTNGNSTISTGNATVDANSLAFANNNFNGQVAFQVINIDGNLSGDIILPDSACGGTCAASANTTTTGNGAGSSSTTGISQTTQNNSSQTNAATIANTINASATTGNNTTSLNTNGNNSINTGSSSVDANSLTLANNNLDGGTYWLVLVNSNGNWSGQIIGGNNNTAATPGLNFSFTPDGNIATSSNGADSQSNTTVTNNVGNTSTQANTTTVNNTLNLSANTGGNHADENTGGSSSITTGSAEIMANLVDFVNNNLSHGAKLIVTIVNVFGTWTGNFITPGHTKQQNNTPQVATNTNTGSGVQNQITISHNDPAATTTQVPPIGDPLPAGNVGLSIPQGNTVLAAVSTNGNMPVVKVAGFQYPSANTKALRVLRINLAWLVIILPILATGMFFRKKLLRFVKQ